jgi:hypothetical protein
LVIAQLNHLGEGVQKDIDLFSSLKKLHKKDLDRYKRVLGSFWRHETIFSLMHSPEIVNFLKSQFGWSGMFLPGGQVVLVMSDELKIPDGYFGLVPHQDFPSVQGSLNGVVVWIPLTDVDESNFTMEVIPKSHSKGLLTMIDRGSSTWEVSPSEYDAKSFIPIKAKVGDVVFMSMFTIHRSSIVGLPGRFRLALSTRFDNETEPTYIDRAYPTAYIRTVHREQFVKNFPSQEQVTDIFSR